MEDTGNYVREIFSKTVLKNYRNIQKKLDTKVQISNKSSATIYEIHLSNDFFF